MLHKAFLVLSVKGPAVFLTESAAEQYAVKWHGEVIKLYGTSNIGNDLRQTGENSVICKEQL
jgi:hypothetical protein